MSYGMAFSFLHVQDFKDVTLGGHHVASSPPFNLVNSQRPPPHSFNWTSWYWGKQKGRVNILSRHRTHEQQYFLTKETGNINVHLTNV